MRASTLKFSDLHTVHSAVKILAEVEDDLPETIAEMMVYRSLVVDRDNAFRAFDLADRLGLLTSKDGKLVLTNQGQRIGGQEELEALRYLFRQTLVRLRRDLLWMAYLDERSLAEHDSNLHKITKNLKLWSRTMEHANAEFWSDLRNAGKYQESSHRVEAGLAAEGLTMEFEQQRLAGLGFLDLSKKVRWVSQDSDLHGYDILSYSGQGQKPSQPIHIEVKSLSHDRRRGTYFYLSRNEFDQASALRESYFFYLWGDKNAAGNSPIKLTASHVLDIVPTESATAASFWTERIVVVDI